MYAIRSYYELIKILFQSPPLWGGREGLLIFIKMAYDKFSTINSPAVPLPIENVDTDQIIPARFLKAVERKGFGDNLFRDWRYNKDGSPKADFPLNRNNFV